MKRTDLLKQLADNKGRDYKLPNVYAKLFTVGELLDLCEAQETAKKHFEPSAPEQKKHASWWYELDALYEERDAQDEQRTIQEASY